MPRALALVESLRRDCPNVKRSDLKTEWQEFWL